jgi:hypothetical protein
MKKLEIIKYKVFRKIKYNYKIYIARIVRISIKIKCKRFILFPFKRNNDKSHRYAQVILDPVHNGWVIEKIAKKLTGHYSQTKNVDLHFIPKHGYAITHWMHYMNVSRDFIKIDKGIHTFLVPHIDSSKKDQVLIANLEAGAFPIFFSRDHAKKTFNRLNLDYIPHHISPGSDLADDNYRFRVVVSSHVYPDGRKNEHYLIQLAHEFSLSKFQFIFIGKSWSIVAENLKKAGAIIEWFDPSNSQYPNYKQSLDIIRSCNLFLYLGNDEGSLGALDAYLLGIPLLISNQGFHQEFVERKDVFLFDTYYDFKTKIIELSSAVNVDYRKNWTWYAMFTKYVEYWDSIINRKLPQ